MFFGTIFSINKNNNIKDKKTLKEKNDYSKLLSKNQAKKGLTRIEFDNFANTLDDTFLLKLDKKFNGFKLFHNKIIDFFHLNHQKKFNTLKKFLSNDNKYYRAGIPIVTDKNKVWVDAGSNHSLIIGTTNSGKTYSVIHILLMLCAMNGENIIVNDVKGELFATHYAFLKERGYKVCQINFIEPKKSNYYNPLAPAILYRKKAYKEYKDSLINYREDIIDLLNLIIEYDNNNIFDNISYQEILSKLPTPNFSRSFEVIADVCNKICQESKSQKDSFFNDVAGDVLEGLVYLFLEEYIIENGKIKFLKDDVINFSNILLLSNYLLPMGNKPSEIMNYLNKYRKKDDMSYLRLAKMLDTKADKTLSNIVQVLARVTKKLTLNADLINMMSTTDLNLSKIDDEKTAIFIIVHDEKDTFHNLTAIIIQQIYEELIATSRNNFSLGLTKSETLKIPFNFLWDEFANGARVDNIVNYQTAGRSRGVRFNFVIQDLGQLEALYGKDKAKTIMSNVVNIIFLLSSYNYTKQEISKACGDKIVYNKAHNRYDKQPVISTDRLSHLALGDGVIIRQRHNPYIAHFKPFNKYIFTKYLNDLRKKIPLPKERTLKSSTYYNLLKKDKEKEVEFFE